MSDEAKMKPCPFGCPVTRLYTEDGRNGAASACGCGFCGIKVRNGTLALCLDTWNRRTPAPTTGQRKEADAD